MMTHCVDTSFQYCDGIDEFICRFRLRCKHATRDTTFTLVVDDFGVSYSNQADVDHLVATLKTNDYLLTIKDDGNTYLGMTIKFNTKLNTVNMHIYVSLLGKSTHTISPTLPLTESPCCTNSRLISSPQLRI